VADAGWIGVVEENGVRLMASEGYGDELNAYQEALFPLDFPTIAEAIEKGQPQWRQGIASTGQGLLTNARIQAAIPLRREAKSIGIILLESTKRDTWPDESQEFVSRLSDHAAIAIANAQLYAEVQAANLAKSDFVSFVSHELKTPMTSIKGFSDLLAAGVVGPINENQANFLNTIRSNIDRMVTLVSDLADVSRIEAGRLRLEFSSVPVQEIVDEVVRSVQSQLADKKQEIQLMVAENLPPMWGDRIRLIQVLTNLVSNAIKYSSAGCKSTLFAEEVPNQWDAAGPPRVIHISVKDQGFGISPEDQKKIFQKFFRAENQKVRDIPGTGLGLNITRTLVEMQGGKIWFESVLNEGTTFHFTVPVTETS
jgi:signal transduction histidine kinase